MRSLTQSNHDAEVRELLRGAAGALLARLPELTDELVTRVRGGDEAYCTFVPADDHWQSTREGLRIGITTILQDRHERRDLPFTESMARRRAEQGLPVDSLMRMYRLAAQVMWSAIVEYVEREQPERIGVLVRVAGHVWHAIDRQALVAGNTYRRREQELLGRNHERVNALLDALLDGTADAGVVRGASAALDLPERARFAVVTVRFPIRHDHEGTRLPEKIGQMRFMWRMRTGHEVGVVALGDASLDDLTQALRLVVSGVAGVSPVVESLVDLGDAHRLAELAMRTCADAGPEIARLDQRLATVLVICQPELSGHLVGGVLGPLLALEGADRDVLLTTLETWLLCEGSAARAAGRLYCHRNTIINRIRRIEQLTGRSLSRPRDIVDLTLALDAVRLLPL
ncbi:helix-turn-helix domain-containing protein [Herbidospora sp. NBRC 101105]|uniref:helix-turn-helix domain-containing protein n=1 Tax=Herbidospora sp. NBRC 101105 TaxID=3032195 RepID=UPI0024A2A81A|nr:helix-turn-helix domain-containing protein [Herbidospora sp. NBRC 101105]GLX93527.1 PucR family transcriptional regulator [Herbidospora sp. NBRC 101105]